MTRRLLSLVLGTLVMSAASAFAGTAKGTFTVNGKTFNLKNAYASTTKNPFDKKKTATVVILTDKEIPPEAVYDQFARMDLPDKGISGVIVEFDDEKKVYSGTLFSPAFKKMKQFSSTGNQKLDVTKLTSDHVTGKVSIAPDDFFDEKYQYSSTFDTAIVAKPVEKPVVLKGTPLPAGGGDPGKAWEVYRKAITKGDLAGIRKTIASELVKDTESPDFKQMLPLIQTMQPKHVKINSGSVDGDNATLLVSDLDDKTSNGTITMRKEGGQWKLVKESWKSRSE